MTTIVKRLKGLIWGGFGHYHEQRRLANQIESYSLELEGEINSRELADADWIEHATLMLDRAETALDEGNLVKAFNYLHQAQRHEIFYFAGQDIEQLEQYARDLLDLVKFEDAVLGAPIRDRLLDTSRGTMDLSEASKGLTAGDLKAAYKQYHDALEAGLETRLMLGRFTKNWIILGAVLGIVLLVHVRVNGEAALPSQPDTPINTDEFLVSVILAGGLGGWLRGAIEMLSNLGRNPRFRSNEINLVRLRLIVLPAAAMVSALVVYAVINSGLLVAQVVTPGIIFAFAVLAGFSIEWTVRTITSIGGAKNTRSDTE